MEIYRLYEITKKWETALILTKPRHIKKIRVSPIIKDDIIGMGEGELYSYLKIYIETKDTYTELILGWDSTHYKDASERKWAEEVQTLSLMEFVEERTNNNYINIFWKDFNETVTWKSL